MVTRERPSGPYDPRVAVYPGSFDPVTNGHLDLIQRSTRMFDRVIVAVLVNASKSPLFGPDERVIMARDAVGGLEGVEVEAFDGLLVDYVARVGAGVVVRGLRAVSDFEYEYQMALMNRHLAPTLETVFMVPSLDTTYISASLVREVARFGGRLDELVHPVVAAALKAKFAAKPR